MRERSSEKASVCVFARGTESIVCVRTLIEKIVCVYERALILRKKNVCVWERTRVIATFSGANMKEALVKLFKMFVLFFHLEKTRTKRASEKIGR